MLRTAQSNLTHDADSLQWGGHVVKLGADLLQTQWIKLGNCIIKPPSISLFSFHSIPTTCSKLWLSCDVVLWNTCPCQSRDILHPARLQDRVCNADALNSRQESGGSSEDRPGGRSASRRFQLSRHSLTLSGEKRGENNRRREGERRRALQGADKMNWGGMQFLGLTRFRLHNVYFSILFASEFAFCIWETSW